VLDGVRFRLQRLQHVLPDACARPTLPSGLLDAVPC
jgi:hypothetical protein